jgi:hypothetical protein
MIAECAASWLRGGGSHVDKAGRGAGVATRGLSRSRCSLVRDTRSGLPPVTRTVRVRAVSGRVRPRAVPVMAET